MSNINRIYEKGEEAIQYLTNYVCDKGNLDLYQRIYDYGTYANEQGYRCGINEGIKKGLCIGIVVGVLGTIRAYNRSEKQNRSRVYK